MKLILLEDVPIFQQLQLEESLLRLGKEDYCILNSGSPAAIVMGISAKPEEVICRPTYLKNPLPIIRRYSGGGTVVVDPSTLFISWIFNNSKNNVSPYPKEVMKWSYAKIQTLFPSLPIQLRENDYVIADKKCGGNAQYFIKDRFVHHTSFLWDYNPLLMNYLLFPPKSPEYRSLRSHAEFLTTLNAFYPSKEVWFEQLKKSFIEKLNFSVSDIPVLNAPHRQATTFVEWS